MANEESKQKRKFSKRRESEEDEVTEEEVDIEEDVNALLGGEELSEEFKEKAKVIFEVALILK